MASREKVPNVLSQCHTKRSMGVRGRAHTSFGMTPTFHIFLNFFFLGVSIFFSFFEKSVSYKKKDGRGHARPSYFWYELTQAIYLYKRGIKLGRFLRWRCFSIIFHILLTLQCLCNPVWGCISRGINL